MNNFPIESAADLFGNGLLGSCNGLFESQLHFLNDMPLIHDMQPHLAYYSGEIQNDFDLLATVGYDISLGSTCEPVKTEISAPDSGTIGPADRNTLAVVPDDTAVKSEDVKPVVDVGSVDVGREGVACGDSVPVVMKSESAELLSDPNETCDVKCGTETSENDDEPNIDISISNVVCVFNTKCYLSLKRVALEGMNVEHKKATGTVLMKLRKPMVTANIWASGKVTCTGSKSEEDAHIAARKVARCLQKIYKNAKFSEFHVVNVLGTCSLPFGIRIADFSRCYPKEASYEPEIHPGVTYRIVTPKATLKIFSTGSITVTAPRVINVQRAVEHIYPLVVKFRMDRSKGELLEAHSSVFKQQSNNVQQSMPSLKRPNEMYRKEAKHQRLDDASSDDSEVGGDDACDNERWKFK